MGEAQKTPTEDDLKYLRESYGEVLDATKHQDEKIGRILAAVSFLTAAALALVTASEIGLGRRFVLGDVELPLLAYTFAAFVIGVVFSVTLLLTSVTTALTLPRSTTQESETEVKSLVYFNSIARAPYDKWEAAWQADAGKVRERLHGNYVEETYNLAVRTSYKYGRTREAVAVLRPTLFALGASVVLAAAIATAPPIVEGKPVPPVDVGPGLTQTAAAFVAAYTFVVMLVARRELTVAQRAKGSSDDQKWWARNKTLLPEVFAPAFAAASLVAVENATMRVIGVVTLSAAMAVELAEDVTTRRGYQRPVVYVLVALTAGVMIVAGDVAFAWLGAACIPLVLAVIDLFAVETRISRELRGPKPTKPA